MNPSRRDDAASDGYPIGQFFYGQMHLHKDLGLEAGTMKIYSRKLCPSIFPYLIVKGIKNLTMKMYLSLN